MASRPNRTPRPTPDLPGQCFNTAEEAWFWFMQCYAARADGARVTGGAGMTPRPCEPTDILRVLDRLWRQRRLMRDHVLVLRHYGRRLLPPDPHRRTEARAYTLWCQALERIEPVLVSKGIVAAREEGDFHAQAERATA